MSDCPVVKTDDKVDIDIAWENPDERIRYDSVSISQLRSFDEGKYNIKAAINCEAC